MPPGREELRRGVLHARCADAAALPQLPRYMRPRALTEGPRPNDEPTPLQGAWRIPPKVFPPKNGGGGAFAADPGTDSSPTLERERRHRERDSARLMKNVGWV